MSNLFRDDPSHRAHTSELHPSTSWVEPVATVLHLSKSLSLSICHQPCKETYAPSTVSLLQAKHCPQSNS